ncbi:hypothetical protein [Dictyobacter kobayashii]|uniref:hypothetical protein n=1 Tax=Dictyobacter kobayashii TaxID=2014872 RepID=UPI000F8461DC|nr:hypothetical protein [Dictyobacter kobayashii]
MRKQARLCIKIGIIIILLLILEATVTQEWSINDVVRLVRGAQEVSLSLTGDDSFFFQVSPPWGKAVLDGKPVEHLPLSTNDTPISLAPGQHTLQWNAEPFPTQSCKFTVPVSSSPQQNCVLTQIADSSRADTIYMVSFPDRLSLKSLAPEQQSALLQAIQSYLDTFQAHETVQPGEPFRYNATSPIQTAAHPLAATLRFLLDTDVNMPTDCQGPLIGVHCQDGQGSDCRLICTRFFPQPDTLNGIPAWDVFVITRPTWTYRAVNAPDAAKDSLEGQAGDQQYTFLQIFWIQHTWHVLVHKAGDSSFDDPNCTLMISNILAISTNTAIQNPSFTSNQNRALGCLATIGVKEAHSQPSNAYFLWRFGVFTAVNPAAHQLQPQLPITDPRLQPVIQEIQRHPAIIS